MRTESRKELVEEVNLRFQGYWKVEEEIITEWEVKTGVVNAKHLLKGGRGL